MSRVFAGVIVTGGVASRGRSGEWPAPLFILAFGGRCPFLLQLCVYYRFDRLDSGANLQMSGYYD